MYGRQFSNFIPKGPQLDDIDLGRNRSGLQGLRATNLHSILALIWEHAPISRAQLAAASGLAPSSVTRLTQDLGELGLIRESGKGESSGGRQPILIEPDGAAGFVVAVDLSGARLRAAAFDAANRQLQVIAEPFIDVGAEALTRQVGDVVDRLARAIQSTTLDQRLIGVGVSIPGSVDSANGVVLESYLLRLIDVPLGSALAGRFGAPVVLEHDASVAALAERFHGAARGLDDLIYVLVANGIGSGILLGGRVYSGRTGRSGQLGHVILDRGGPLCVCGNQGCLEALAAGPAIVAHARRVAESGTGLTPRGILDANGPIDVAAIVRAADEGDATATGILANSADYVALGIASYVRLLDVEHVIVGGEVVEESAAYYRQLETSLHRYMGQLGRVTLRRGALRHRDHLRGLSRLTIEKSVPELLGIASARSS